MGKRIKRIIAVLSATALAYLLGVALLFLNYNWTVFVQFVKEVSIGSMITLIVPGLVAGAIGHALWGMGKKS